MSTLEHSQLFQHSQQVLSQSDCLFTTQQVDAAIDSLAERINHALCDTHPIIIAVMNGGLIPCGLLLPRLNFPLQTDYIHASRYGMNTSGNELNWMAKPSIKLAGRTVLLVDDIHDEGITLKHLVEYCQQQGAKKVYSCALIYKEHNRKGSKVADFVGLTVPDRYVFGYGMDYKTMLRNAPGIYAVKEDLL